MTLKQTVTSLRGALAHYAKWTTMTAALTVLLLSQPITTHAAEPVDSVEIKVYFPVAKSEIDLGFHGNGERLAQFFRILDDEESDSMRRVESIHVVGYASPEGGHDFNQQLAQHRAEVLARYILQRRHIPDTLLYVESGGIDWEGLDRALSRSGMEDAYKAQYLIRHEPERTFDSHGKLVRSRKQQLMNLEGGRTWRRMLTEIFPDLRASASVVCYFKDVPQPEPQPVVTEEPTTDTSAMEAMPEEPVAEEVLIEEGAAEEPKEDLPRYPIFALRSNLLVPLLNVGLEVPVAEHWSVGVDYYYPWIWPAKSNKNCFELIFVSAEARYWINPQKGRDSRLEGKNCLTGHSVGVYGAWGYYDFERNFHGHQGHGWSVGADYLFSLPVAKGKLRIEFELAVGALWSRNAQPYNVYEEGGKLIREFGHRKNFFYFGPTKVGVSLVVPITRKLKPATPPLP